jgi:hypothetical protein
VNIFFDTSTPVTGSSAKSNTQGLGFPLMTINDIAERERRRNLHITDIIRGKLKRLQIERLIRRNPKAIKLGM